MNFIFITRKEIIMADYDPAVLRRLQLTILEILKDIDSICKENNIEYYIAYGTALGAVRHGGFIPWDDDIDICMTREAYDRFLEVMPNAMPEKYDLLDIKNTNKYSMCFAKVSKKGTQFKEKVGSAEGYEQGIFVDVFPLDYAPDDEKERKRVAKKAWFYSHMIILREIDKPIIPNEYSPVKKAIVVVGCKVVHGLMNIFHISKLGLYDKYLKVATSYKKSKNYMTDYCAMHTDRVLNKTSDLFPLKEIKFEDSVFPVPNNLDVYLTHVYNNYMELPKPENRHNHLAEVLDFGD